MKSINVYGTGERALRFILNNRYRMDIRITNVISSDEYENDEFCGIPVTKISNAGNIIHKYYNVVASSEVAYWQIKDKLYKMHMLMEFEHFIYWEVFEKKVAIVYGNCHTGPIKEMLRRSIHFSHEYGLYPIPQIQEIKRNGNIATFFSGVKGRCQLFIHQSIWEKNIYGIEYSSYDVMRLLELHATDCKIIGIPNVYRMPRFMFPQMEYGDVMHEGCYGFQFRDSYIDQNYKTMTVAKMVRAIKYDLELFDNNFVLEKYDEFLKKLFKREKEWDVQISDLIIEKISNTQLFFDPNHPTNILLCSVVDEILKILSINDNASDLAYGVYQLDSFEIPIYGCVKKLFNMKFEQNELRRTGIKLSQEIMTIESYIRQYCCWQGFMIKEE